MVQRSDSQSRKSPAQIRDLVQRGALAAQAETALSTLWSAAALDANGAHAAADAASVIEMATLVVASADDARRAKAA
jgi:hypothetical protein